MGRRYDHISFLSDYGLQDEFVGVVHAVIADLAPHVRVIDLTHGVAPFDVRAGSLALARSIGYVPSGVIVAVVDPGVGSDRRGVAIEVLAGDGVLVGPDNGLLAPAVALAGGAGRVVELTSADHRLPSPGATFDGRDVFAPAAAHLCNGVDLAELGDLIDPDLLTPGVVALPQADDEHVIAQVLWCDRFGNAQLNVGPDDLPASFGDRLSVRISAPTDPTGGTTRVVERATSFSDVVGGSVGLLVDSSGLLAIVMNQRSARDELDLDVGDQVSITALSGEASDGRDAAAVAQPVDLSRRPSSGRR
ncbi:MAG: SAM-dependent chlorinase/fluorinase [Actinomycetota bacterium]